MRVNPNSEPSAVNGVPARTAPSQPRLGQDELALTDTSALEVAWQQTPASRPEKVEAAKRLVQDTNYPPEVLIQKISVLLALKIESEKSAA